MINKLILKPNFIIRNRKSCSDYDKLNVLVIYYMYFMYLINVNLFDYPEIA